MGGPLLAHKTEFMTMVIFEAATHIIFVAQTN
jgi:hypothetical protein